MTIIVLKKTNFTLPRDFIEGDSDSGVSRLRNNCSIVGRRKATAVSDAAATPGVLEKMSDTKPMVNALIKEAQLGVSAGMMIMM